MAFKSLKYNFVLNFVNTAAGLLFPLITFPYVARILDPGGLGIISFLQGIVQYIIILSSLGISLYGVREIARIKDDPHQRDRATVEILLLHLCLSLLGYAAVAVLCLTVSRIAAHESIFLILSIPIIFNAIGVSWFYNALEDFRYITLRSLFFKFLSAIALFIFVKKPGDVTIYAVILVVADVGNNILNLLRLRRFIRLSRLRGTQLRIFRHFRPAVTIFTLNVIVGLYLGMTPVIIGFMADDSAVGYFTACYRLTSAALTIVTALGTTLLPRMSYYIHNGETDLFRSTATRGLDFLIAISLPLSIALAIVAPELILVFSGDEFTPAIPTLVILAPVILIVGIAGILGYQVLYPMGHERLIIRSSLAGLLIYFPVCIFLTSRFSQNGAAAGYVITELIVTSMIIVYSHRYFVYDFFRRPNIITLVSALFMAAALIGFRLAVSLPPLGLLSLSCAIGIVVFALSMMVFHHPFASQFISTVKSKFLR